MNLVDLAANQPRRFYRGGPRIDRFRGAAIGSDDRPEDWVGSTTTIAGERALGLTTLPDGRLLADAVASDPVAWLGRDHVDVFGGSTMLLVKLLDAGQRLPVHAHPDDAFSRAHVNRPFGKAEAWYILEGGDIHLGLRDDVTVGELRRLVGAQDATGLVGLLHHRRVERGDVVFVPPGVLHAIGEGVLLLEVQQPEDQSILLEWRGFALDGERDGHLGLGFDLALQGVVTSALSAAALDALVGAAGESASVLPAAADRFFRLERRVLHGSADVAAGFGVLVVEQGRLTATPEHGDAIAVAGGATVLLPHAAGAVRLDGDAAVLVCRPPTARRDEGRDS